MIGISGALIFGIYAFLGLLLLVNAAINLFHAMRYGSMSGMTIATSTIYLVGVGLIIVTAFFFLRDVPFDQVFEIQTPSLELIQPTS